MNKVLLTGRLTRDPEMRSLASGKNVTTFTVASNEFIGGGREKAEYSAVVTWDRLAEIAGTYLGKGQQVAIEGRLQTRSWDDDRGQRHWKTEVVASHVEMLSGRRKKDYEAQQAADSLVAQAEAYGEAPPSEPIPADTEIEEEPEARGGRRRLTRSHPIHRGGGALPLRAAALARPDQNVPVWIDQPAAFFTRSASHCSSSAVNFVSAKAVGQMVPSSRCALSSNPIVA